MLKSAQWVPETGQSRQVEFLCESPGYSFIPRFAEPHQQGRLYLSTENAQVNKVNLLSTF